MKKSLLLTLVALMALTANARTIWSGSQELDWTASPNKLLQLDATAMGTLKAGDCLVFSYNITVADDQWPQFQLLNTSWVKQEGISLKNGMTETKVYLTSAMATNLTTGMIVAGYGCTLTKIELSEGDGGDYSHAVWIGETVIGNWDGYQQVVPGAFANAQAGQLLRIKFKDLGAGATLSLRNPIDGWPNLSGTTMDAIAGNYQQYTITSTMLSELQANGLIVAGVNFTCTAVEIWNSSELRTLSLQVPVTNNWVFEGTTKPYFTVNVKNPYNESVTANTVVAITTDMLAPVTTLKSSATLTAKGQQNISLPMSDMPAPGIYKATITVNDDLARSFFFAVNPTQIVSAPDMQSDFNSYWSAAKQQLAAIPVNATLTEIPARSGTKRKVYLVEMQSVPDGLSGDPVTIRGYYAEPTDGMKHPVIIHYQGYDSGYRPGGDSSTPWCFDTRSETDEQAQYAEFILSNRGQSVNNRNASERLDGVNRDFTNTYGDWFAFNFGDKDSYYYRGAYMDCLRAIDFMASRATSDMSQLFAEGQSQGGAFTVAAAALSDTPFQAIAPAITFMGDFPDYFQLASWPAYVAFENKGSMTDAQMYAFLSYFDTKNLATLISCPIITSIGLQDNVCPPHTNLAPYNNVQTPEAYKQIVYNPELQHATNSNWNSTYMAFFKASPSTGIINSPLSIINYQNDTWYTLDGRRIANGQWTMDNGQLQLPCGIYIVNGRKVIKK